MVASRVVGFCEIRQPHRGGCPNRSFPTLTNRLAANFHSAIVIAVADVLQRVRHFWKRAPFSILGKASLPISGLSAECPVRRPQFKSSGIQKRDKSQDIPIFDSARRVNQRCARGGMADTPDLGFDFLPFPRLSGSYIDSHIHSVFIDLLSLFTLPSMRFNPNPKLAQKLAQ